MRRYTTLFSSILALSSFTATAHAHGGIPRGLSIEFHPSDPRHVVVAGAAVGLFVSRDGGTSWTLSCYTAQGGTPDGLKTNIPLLVTSSGTVISKVGWSLMHSGDGVCGYGNVPFASQVEDPLAIGVRRAADGSLLALTSTNTGSEMVTELWKSDATGAAFSLSGTRLGNSFAGKSLVVSPSDPDRVYVGGFKIDGGAAIAYTEDAGAHWDVRPFATDSSIENGDVELLAVDPSNPELLFMRSSGIFDPTRGPPQTIWFTPDAGLNWRPLHASLGPVSGFAYSPDGTTIALGDFEAGLFHVDVASLGLTGAPVKERVFASRVWGITWNDAGLYAGLNEFTPAGEPNFKSVGVSHDGGRTFTPFMSVCDVQAPECSAESGEGTCYADFVRDYQVDSGRCAVAGSGGVGGGTGGSPSVSGGGSPSVPGGSGGASATGGAPAYGASSSSASGGGNGDAAPRDDVGVSSCALSTTPNRSLHIVSLTLAASCAAVLHWRRRRRATRTESRKRYV